MGFLSWWSLIFGGVGGLGDFGAGLAFYGVVARPMVTLDTKAFAASV